MIPLLLWLLAQPGAVPPSGPPLEEAEVEIMPPAEPDHCQVALDEVTQEWRICLNGDWVSMAAHRQQAIANAVDRVRRLCPLSRESIRAIFRGHRKQTQHCYEQQLQSNHHLTGRVEVVLTIASDGTVRHATTQASTLANPALEACIVRKVQTWTFPRPPTDEPVEVRYPLVFKPA